MKKYFITAVAALALGGLMTSCTKDTDFSGSTARSSQDVQKTYEEAFLTTFGRPVEGLDWGFGLNTSASTRALTRTITPDYNFSAAIPSKPTTTEMASTNFKVNVDGIDPYPNGGYGRGVCYITGSTDVNIWGAGTPENNYQDSSGGEVYFTGTCNLSGKSVNIAANTTIYIVKDAQVTLDNGFSQNCKIYIAEGAKLTIKNNISTGNVSYYIKGGAFEAKNQLVVNGGHEFFVENGNVKIGGEMQIENATYYAKNTPLEIGGILNLIQRDNPALFYNEGGVIDCDGKLLNNSSKFYTNANSTFAEISENGTCVVYNGANATMTSEGVIRVTNSNADGTDGSVLINDGTLIGTYLGTEGGAFFENNGTTTITGNTVVNSNNNTWVNNGTYNTQYFIYHAGSSQVINNCRMNVSEDFDINLGDNPGNGAFRMDANSGVVTKNLNAGGGFTYNNSNFTGGPFYIYMGAGSVFEVTQTATINATKANYGIYNLGDSWSVFHANKIQCMPGQEGQGYKVTYGGKLYVVSETTHFEQGKSGEYPYIDFKNGASQDNIYASNFHEGKPAITIPGSTTGCNPGYNGNTTSPSDGVDLDATEVRVIAEDLTTYVTSDGKELADFDFNDVVFDVSKSHNADCTDKNGVHIILRAAGGTLPLTVGGDKEQKVDNHGEQVLAYEVHRLFKVSTGTMVNTNSTSNGVTREEPVEFDVPYPNGVTSASTIYEIANAIPIRVLRQDLNTNKEVWIEIQKAQAVSATSESSATGITASKLCVDNTYRWCDERVHIDEVFPYRDAYGNNKGSRFRMYLKGDLKNYWWKETTTVEGE